MHRHRQRRRAWAVQGACAWCGVLFTAMVGCTTPATQLVVLIDSDVDIQDVDIRVTGDASPVVDVSRRVVSGPARQPDEVSIPFSFGVVPRGGDANHRVLIEVDGRTASGESVTTRSRVGFRPGKRLALPIFLSGTCLDVQCGAGQTCERGLCASEEVNPGDLDESPIDGTELEQLPTQSTPDSGRPDDASRSDDAGTVGPSQDYPVEEVQTLGVETFLATNPEDSVAILQLSVVPGSRWLALVSAELSTRDLANAPELSILVDSVEQLRSSAATFGVADGSGAPFASFTVTPGGLLEVRLGSQGGATSVLSNLRVVALRIPDGAFLVDQTMVGVDDVADFSPVGSAISVTTASDEQYVILATAVVPSAAPVPSERHGLRLAIEDAEGIEHAPMAVSGPVVTAHYATTGAKTQSFFFQRVRRAGRGDFTIRLEAATTAAVSTPVSFGRVAVLQGLLFEHEQQTSSTEAPGGDTVLEAARPAGFVPNAHLSTIGLGGYDTTASGAVLTRNVRFADSSGSTLQEFNYPYDSAEQRLPFSYFGCGTDDMLPLIEASITPSAPDVTAVVRERVRIAIEVPGC